MNVLKITFGMSILGMSKEAVKQRLIEMGLLIVEDNACGYWDNAGAVSVGEVLRRIFS